MSVLQSVFTLQKKYQLTNDVFELTYTCNSESATPKPGQYILFILPSGKRRAYSIAYAKNTTFIFIIKRLSHEGAGSAEICDMPLGSEIPGMGPIGHFVLSDANIPRLFIGTGTGFAPLYFQIRALENRGFPMRTDLVFGVRFNEDIFYQDEFKRLQTVNDNFRYIQYLSKGTVVEHERIGYVGDILTPEYIANFSEFLICGSPAMVTSVREKLTTEGIGKTQILFEQF